MWRWWFEDGSLLGLYEMDARFLPYVAHLDSKLKELLEMEPFTPMTLPQNMCESGIYLFSEQDIHFYVGRSNHIRDRLKRHCRPGATHRMAAFAFRLARQETGNSQATYRRGAGSRAHLVTDDSFLQAFSDAKSRIRDMSVRFVEESDPVKQALLEIYVSVVLETPHNQFDNH